MNWEAVGVIVETVGTIVVLVTLIYLSMQIRLAREESQVQSTYSSVNLWANWRSHLINNPDISELIEKANEGQDLSKAEKLRISTFMDEFIFTSYASHATSQKGNPLYTRDAEVEYLVGFLEANPGLESHWERLRDYVDAWDPEFSKKIRIRRDEVD